MESELIPWIFGSILLAGMIYLLFSIIFGGLADLDVGGDLDLDLDGGDAAEARGLGCSVIAAFMAGFGSIGLVGSLSGWGLLFSTVAALAFGLIFGRTFIAAMRFVLRQQSNALTRTESLIGGFARVTIDVPPGKVGEAMIEGESVLKYPVQAASEEVALNKGDYVEIVDIENGRLYVKKKRVE